MENSYQEVINLDKVESVTIGFAWEQYTKQRSVGLISGLISKYEAGIDCDASAYIFKNENGICRISECVDYHNLSAENGSIVHGGDSKTGGSNTDDETITVNLKDIPGDVKHIIFTLDMFKEKKSHLTIAKLDRTHVRVRDSKSGNELADFNICGVGDKAVQVGTLLRTDTGWSYKADIRNLADIKEKGDIAKAIEAN